MHRAGTLHRLIVIALIGILALPLLVCIDTTNVCAASGDWTLRTIGRIAGVSTSLAIDQNDRMHVVYFDSGAGALGYARNDNPCGNWTITSTDGLSTGSQVAMVTDSSSKLHICYYTGFNKELKYATNAGGSFVTQTIDTTTAYGPIGSSIAADSVGKAHISYAKSDKLMYATNAGGSWNVTELQTIYTITYPTYIAIGSDDVVHMTYTSYIYYSSNSTKVYKIGHAWKVGSDWNFETVDSFSAIVGTQALHIYGALTVDTLGRPHIIYTKMNLAAPNDPRLVYSIREAYGWLEPYRIIGLDGWPTAQSIDMMTDAGNKMHAAYYDQSGLKYVTNAVVWSIESVVPYPAGGFPSIDRDSTGKFYISYYDPGTAAGEFKLKYATSAKLPSEPWQFKATPGPGKIDLQWNQPNSTGDFPRLGYSIDLYNVENIDHAVPILSIGVPASNTTHTFTGLYIGYGYYVVIRAASSAGLSDYSAELYAVPGELPSAPTIPLAQAYRNNITLSWYQPMNSNGSALTNYSILWGTTSTALTTEIVLDDQLSYIHHDLTPWQFYYYKVRAKNGIGWGPYSQIVSVMAIGDAPLAPLNLTATAGDESVTLSWSPPPIDEFTPVVTYDIYKSDSPTFFVLNFNVNVGTTTYTDTAVSNGDTIYYKVAARNANGTSPLSNLASAKPMGTAPEDTTGDTDICNTMALIIIGCSAFAALLGGLAIMRLRRRR
jgi:hypothetical protein